VITQHGMKSVDPVSCHSCRIKEGLHHHGLLSSSLKATKRTLSRAVNVFLQPLIGDSVQRRDDTRLDGEG
jgi:hypothetical protein